MQMMRTFEILSCLLNLPLMVSLISTPRRRWIFWLAAIPPIGAVAIHLMHEGAHWQLIPLYLTVVILLIAGIARTHLPRWATIITVILGSILVSSAVALSWLVPMFQLPHPTGQYKVGTHILRLVDQTRLELDGPSPSGKRELMVQAWYPAQVTSSDHHAVYQRRKEVTRLASYRSVLKTNSYQDAALSPGGPYPVLLYNPGWMGERTEGSYQMEELASHGFFIVAIDHTFFGGLVEFPDGRVTNSHGAPELGNFENSTVEEQWALGSHYVHIEAEDNVFVLNQLEAMNQDPQSPWFHRLDMTRVGAMGFSIGGAVASQTAFQDPRVKAALNIDGWTFGDVGQHGLAKPWMVIYEDKSQTVPSSEELTTGPLPVRRMKQADLRDYTQVVRSMQQNGGYLLFVAGTHHVDFTDRVLFSPLASLTGRGSLSPARTHAIANAYTLAFFSHVLNGSREPILVATPSPFSEVEFQAFKTAKP